MLSAYYKCTTETLLSSSATLDAYNNTWHITQSKREINERMRTEGWGLPEYLGHGGGESWGTWRSSHQSPSWQTDSQAGGCLKPTHMGHLTVIKSCGTQPEPVKLINSLVFSPSRRGRERLSQRERKRERGEERNGDMRDQLWNNTQRNMQVNLSGSEGGKKERRRCRVACRIICSPPLPTTQG